MNTVRGENGKLAFVIPRPSVLWWRGELTQPRFRLCAKVNMYVCNVCSFVAGITANHRGRVRVRRRKRGRVGKCYFELLARLNSLQRQAISYFIILLFHETVFHLRKLLCSIILTYEEVQK